MVSDQQNVELREYFERLLEDHEKLSARSDAELERRLDGLNQLRSEVVKDREVFLRRDVYDEGHKALTVRFDIAERAATARIEVVERNLAWIIGVGSALVALSFLVGYFLNHVITK